MDNKLVFIVCIIWDVKGYDQEQRSRVWYYDNTTLCVLGTYTHKYGVHNSNFLGDLDITLELSTLIIKSWEELFITFEFFFFLIKKITHILMIYCWWILKFKGSES